VTTVWAYLTMGSFIIVFGRRRNGSSLVILLSTRRLAHEDGNVSGCALSVVGVGGVVLVADGPEIGLLVGCSETGAELHFAAAVTHHDLGMLYEIVVPYWVLWCAAQRGNQKHTVPVGDVHQRDRQGAATLGPRHGDEANVAAPEAIEQTAAGEAIQKHLQAREGRDYPARQRCADARRGVSGLGRHGWASYIDFANGTNNQRRRIPFA
jgi:hypothetical protein